MKVYIELNKLSDREIINIMQVFVFAWNGDTETKRNEWQALLNAFEQVRTSSAETDRIFNGIEYHEQCAFSFLVVRIVKDWDRLSFSHLYTRSCQRWNRENGLIMNDCVTELRDLGSNEKTIDYACKVDLENIEELYKAGDTDRLTELLYYSEDCDDDEQQCSYKVKAESKIRRCLERLSRQSCCSPPQKDAVSHKIGDPIEEDERTKLIWQTAQKAGYIDDNRQWIDKGHTKRQRAIVAHEIGTLIGVNYDKYFTTLWGCRKMSTDYCNALQTDKDQISDMFKDALRKAGYFAS